VGRGKRAAAGLRRLPTAELIPYRLPIQEADVPTAASLTPSAARRYGNSQRSDPKHGSPKSDRLSHCAPSVRSLLQQAQNELLDAEYAAHPVDRYARAHLAALRAAAAVLAVRTRPRPRAKPTNAWVLLATVAPELAEWSAFFAASATTRAAAEAGVHRLVTDRDADDLVRQAGEFIALARHAVARTSR
jgi:hypothetical protein